MTVIFECPDGWIRLTAGPDWSAELYEGWLRGMADEGYRRIGEIWV